MSARVFQRKVVNELGNLPRTGAVPKFSDLEAIALTLMAESMSTDSKKISVRNAGRMLQRSAELDLAPPISMTGTNTLHPD